MSVAYGIRWDDGKRIRLTAALLAALVALAAFVGMKAGCGPLDDRCCGQRARGRFNEGRCALRRSAGAERWGLVSP